MGTLDVTCLLIGLGNLLFVATPIGWKTKVFNLFVGIACIVVAFK